MPGEESRYSYIQCTVHNIADEMLQNEEKQTALLETALIFLYSEIIRNNTFIAHAATKYTEK